MTSTNIEQFDLMVGQTLAYLYNSFPIPKNLSISTFIDKEKVYVEDGLTGTELTPEAEFAYATFAWLYNAGYINGELHYAAGVSDAVLSAKGLETLKAVPDSLQGSLGERLADATKSNSLDVVKSLTTEVLSIGMRMFL